MAKARLRFVHAVYMVTGQRGSYEKRKIMGAVGSVRRDEFYLAMREGIKPKIVLDVRRSDYRGETLVEVEGSILSVYRIYENEETGITELYLIERKGNQ